jgi:AmmeMemoRadiSam system protein A
MNSSEAPQLLSPAHRRTLLEVARRSIQHGLSHGVPLPVVVSEYHRDLKALRASFITLNIDNNLRGCIGHLEPVQPLVVDVAENAFSAAFRDLRFSPLTSEELPFVKIHVSVLSTPEPMVFNDEADLLSQLRPGEDGLILQDGVSRGTFLPSVWDSLPTPGEFISHLKLKAGLAPNHWSDTLKVSRYHTESFGET